MDSQYRTIAKTITFRIAATAATIILVFFFTKNFAIAGTIGVLDFFVKLLIYYFHERIWDTVSWGSKKHL